MLQIYNSSNLYRLARARLLQKKVGKDNPLVPEIMVVQNHGMARWLSLYMAERQGIAANNQFKFPAELYWQLMHIMNPDIPENLPSERLPMSWALFKLIQSDSDPRLSEIHRYIRNPDPQKREMRCWNLASRMADVFDEYLTYRPEMLLAWEKQKMVRGNSSEYWQSVLWRKLITYWHSTSQKDWNHRAKLQTALIKAIDREEISLAKLPKLISIFAVSEMPPIYLKTFLKLSKCVDVDFYRVEVNANSADSFIRSMGQTGNAFQSLTYTFLENDKKIKYNNIAQLNAAKPNSGRTHFQIIKQHLLDKKEDRSLQSLDNSIQVHSCHSPRREVEVLYDQLLKMLDDEETLNPADILVLCPQMEIYAPAVEAVFGAVEQGMPQIPFNLAETTGASNIVDIGFLKIMELAGSRFKVTDVLDLLDCPPVRQAFSLTEENVNTLEKWIGDTHIRWGIDGQHKRELGLPESKSYTWQSGLHRMLAGFSMAGGEDQLFNNIYPYTEIQQSAHAQLLGRFSQLMQQLFKCHQQVRNRRPPQQWGPLLNRWLDQFFAEEEPFVEPVQGLRNVLHAFGDQTRQAAFTDDLSFAVIQDYLQDRIDQKSTRGGRPGQGVAFSSLVPMRNIPAKVICLIGMNDGAFPRTKNAVEFDLIAQNPQPGDRLPGKDDRQLFLEIILAAGERIYFSYVGQSNRKDVAFPPSVVLQEWIDYVCNITNMESDNIIQHHRLHSFSPQYFKNNSINKLFSYSQKNNKIASRLSQSISGVSTFLEERLPEPDAPYKTLSVDEFTAFFQHPAKYLFRERLGVYMGDESVIDEDRENFELNALEKYTMGQELMSRYMKDQSMDTYKDVAFAKNELPDGWPGHHQFENQLTEVGEFSRVIKSDLQQQKPVAIEVDYAEGDFHISGTLDQVYKQYQLFYRVGRARAKDLIELWIKHLMLQMNKPAGHPGKSRLYSRNRYKSVVNIELAPVLNSAQIIDHMLNVYWSGLQGVILFFPNISYAYAQAIFNGKNEKQAFEAAQKEWVDNDSDHGKEGDDPYNKRLINGINPLSENKLKDKFKQVSEVFWSPFFQSRNKAKQRD